MKRGTGGLVLVLLAGLLAACAGGRDSPIAKRLHDLEQQIAPTPARFILCAGHGCRDRHVVALTSAQWARIRARFSPAPPDAAAERQAIRLAVADLEVMSGEQTGTSADRAGTYLNMFAANQLDCADETVNVTTYLRLMIDDGLITRHRPGGRVHKGNFLDSLPHMAPTLVDKVTGIAWVIDAWYHDNGHLPETVPATVWHTPWETWRTEGQL